MKVMNPPLLDYQAGQSRLSDYVASTSRPASWWRNLSLMVGWMALAAVLLGCGFGSSLAPCIILVLATSMILRSVRRRRGMAVLGYLDQAVRLNQPLPESLSAAARGESHVLRRRLYSLRDALVGGASVGLALEACVPEVPRVLARTVGSAEMLGVLQPTLRSILDTERQRRDSHAEDWFFARFYPLVVISTAIAVASILMVYVVPKFERIYLDFKADAGPWFVSLVWFSRNFGMLLLVLVAGFLWVFVALRLWEIFLQSDRQAISRKIVDWVFWHVPLLAGSERAMCLANAMRLLSAGVDAGHSLPDALLHVSSLGQNECFARQVERWCGAMLHGASAAEGARQARLPALVVGMLGCAPASIPDTLRFQAVHYAARSSRMAGVLRAVLIPVLTLLLSVLVFWVVMAIFDPLIRMIKIELPMGGFQP